MHLDPSEAAAVWAYELDWRPLPVFQPYIAWTQDLDERNAEAVASRTARSASCARTWTRSGAIRPWSRPRR